MKRIASIVLFLLLSVIVMQGQDVKVFAHRGCWSKNSDGTFIVPENSVPAVREARKNGYVGVEIDVRYTKDDKMVVLHDIDLNRTVRRAKDYSKLDRQVLLSDLTFEELRNEYVLESSDPAYRTPVPTLEEILLECRRFGLVPMLHSTVLESYEMAQELFGDGWICFADDYDKLLKVREFSDCVVLYGVYDAVTAANSPEILARIGGKCGISSMTYSLYSESFCHSFTDAGYQVQASVFPEEEEIKALKNGITYILTDHRIHTKKEKRRLRRSAL